MATVLEILTRQANLLGLSVSGLSVAPALTEFAGYINGAIAEICRFGDWPWLYARISVTSAAGADEVSLPADFVALRPRYRPYYADGSGRLEWLDGEVLSLRRGGGLTAGRPLYWNEAYNAAGGRHQFTLWPQPDAAYAIVLEYKRRVLPVSALDDVPTLPPELDEVLMLGSCAAAEEGHERMEAGSQRPKFQAALAAAWADTGSTVRDQAKLTMRPFDLPLVDWANLNGPILVLPATTP